MSRKSVVSLLLIIFISSFTANIGAQQTCSTTGVQNTAVLLVTFPGRTPPVTAGQVSDVFFGTSTGRSLDGYWREASYGQASATGNVYGWYTLTGSYSCLNMPQLMNDAIAAATASGVTIQNYTRISIVMPNLGCGWVGLTMAGSAGGGCSIWSTPAGTLTASVSFFLWDYMSPRDRGVAVVAHESGHQLGLMHSGLVNASPEVLGPVGSPGALTEYGDNFAAMSAFPLGHYSSAHKAEVLNWMANGSNYQVVQNSGTYVLQPLEMSPPGLQALKVQRGTGNNAWLWVEYRQPVGNYDSTLPTQPFSGALIHYEDSSTIPAHSYLLNFNPGDTTWNSPALVAGKSWTDPYSNVSISVQSATSSGLTVSVNYGAAPCTHASPTVSISPANPSLYPGGTANYTVWVTNNDTSACSSSTITLGSSAPSGWATSFSAASLTLNPGQTGSVTMGKGAPAGTAPGTYPVNASATANSLAGSATANATVLTVPSLTASLSVSGSSFTRRQTVSCTAKVLSGGVATSGASVTFTLTEANGKKVTRTATTDSAGTAIWKYKINQKDPTGTWSAVAQTSYNSQAATSNAVSFTVQ